MLTVHALARNCGARIVSMGATHHDEAVAQVSHLPQLMSSLTATRLNEVQAPATRRPGVRDVTRIAAIRSSAVDPDHQRQRGHAVRTELEAVRDTLDELLEGWGDEEALRRFPRRRTPRRPELPGKHGTGESAYAEVIVAIPDTPGALARLFAGLSGTVKYVIALFKSTLRQASFSQIVCFLANTCSRKLSLAYRRYKYS